MGKIYITYGNHSVEMTVALLNRASLAQQLDSEMTVVIKPNLVVARPAQEGATTHPEIVEGVLQFLKEHRIHNIQIAEGAWLAEDTQRAFQVCGYEHLAKKYGIRLIDTKKDRTVRKTFQKLSLDVCESIVNADFLINIPVLKGHCQTAMTCCLKNMKGCIPDREKRRYHNLGLHEPIAALNTILKPNLHLIDHLCGDPTFEEGGNPVTSNRIILGTDPVLLDSYAASLLGLSTNEVPYIQLAHKYKVGNLFCETTEIVEIGKQQTEDRIQAQSVNDSDLVRRYARLIDARSACSACYSALIVALRKAGIHKLPEPIKIGQGFLGQTGSGLGVGNCTKGCTTNIPGCPPNALEMVKAFNNLSNQ